ncbi:aldo/keto reductase [Desulfonema ishimotonii]|uniref:Aldo/keto reductase n=1 Tax=Desulfonema ishimotonii TaxID=45657 RepID=A0A401FW64_9BACT|nr:aldo/keto reductase [Desulfonema ishimotonii]GBC61201.1 aldo/keto reductase [Desulfonema ishimotonii]
MLYRKMPKNGDELSILGFGCMRLPVTEERQIDEPRAIRQIRDAIDRGVNYLDTAWPYHAGESENVLGRALADGYRDRVKIATKLPSWMIRIREDMDTYLNAQLEKLKTDHIDYYLLHALAGDSWDHLESLGVAEFLDKARSDGRIVNAGFSFHGVLEDFKRIVDGYPWEFCQIQYNFLDEENQAGTEGLKYAASKDLGVVIMEPLRGGNLGLPTPPPDVEAIWKTSPVKRTPVEWALRWVWNHPEVTVVLSGMNEEAHIEENLAIAAQAFPNSLTEDDIKRIESAGRKYKTLMKVGCTGCGYCMPCPSDVSIPGCFEVYNKLHMFGNVEEAKVMYAVRMSGIIRDGSPSYASQCVQCGECLEKCPQHIEIPDFLEKVAEELEDSELEQRVAMAKKMLNIT